MSAGSTGAGRALGGFFSSYGWRAYAIPVLVVATVLGVFGVTQPDPSSAPQPDAGTVVAGADPSGTLDAGADPTTSEPVTAPDEPNIPDGNVDPTTEPTADSSALPDGGSFPESGAQQWHVVPGTTPQVGTGTESVSTYTVEVEDGMDTSSFGGDESFGRFVDETLADPRGWTDDGRFAFQRIDSGEPTFRIALTSQLTVRGQCGYTIKVEASCFNRSEGGVVVNVARWVRGAAAFRGDVGSYRQYVVNHEVGHAIGFRQHRPCESDGSLAPIMMQQTFSTANDEIAMLDPQGVVAPDGATCRPNPWPSPRA